MYLHELVRLRGGLQLPSPPPPPDRDPELEARIVRLRAQQANREYAQMTRDVRQDGGGADQIAPASEVKVVRSQLAAVFNLLLTVVGAFAFTYFAVEYALPEPDVAVQVFTALLVAIVVAGADLYFLMKQLAAQG